MRDLRYFVRMTLRAPGFTAAVFAAATLGLCGSPSLGSSRADLGAPLRTGHRGESHRLEHCQLSLPADIGESDSAARIARSVARFAEVKVDPQGSCRPVSYEREEQIYFILEGSGILHYGEEEVPVRKNDFMYLPPGITHTISGSANQPCRMLVMGFRIPARDKARAAAPARGGQHG